MRKTETLLSGLLWVGAALLLPIAALEPVSVAGARAATPALALGVCADGTVHLAMGCASISL